MMLLLIIQYLVLILQIGLGLLAGYLLLLSAAALRAKKQSGPLPAFPASRFLIVIPAHNEEKVISKTLQNLAGLDYPREAFSVHVVADNCSDRTAELVRQHGANVYERSDANKRGKGYALQWLLEIMFNKKIAHDAVVFLDADSTVSANFLRVMDLRVQRGERAIQAYYSVSEPVSSVTGGLRYAALALVHFVRPQGRMILGGSAGLKGNGMVFCAELVKKMTWSASITEDIEQHMALIMDGERVTFAPDAVVWGEMPDTFAGSESQVARWESGRVQLARKYVGPLLVQGLARLARGNWRGAYVLFDAALEHLIPPFSLFVAASLLALLTSAGLAGGMLLESGSTLNDLLTASGGRLALFNLVLGAAICTAHFIYLFAGLWMVNAPAAIYKKLLFAPLFVLWKIGNFIRVLLRGDESKWVRTTRNQERK